MVDAPIPSQESLINRYNQNMWRIREAQNRIRSLESLNQDPDRQRLLASQGDQFSERDRELVRLNPWIVNQNQEYRSLVQQRDQIAQENQSLWNDFRTLYWRAIEESAAPWQFINQQTQNLLKWTSLWELEASWFALWQATKRGASEAMKGKVRQDVESQWEQQRAQIRANQAQQQTAASQQRAETLLGVWGQLQQQQQQDFENALTQQQMQLQQQQQALQQRRRSIRQNAATQSENRVASLVSSILWNNE